MTPSMHKAPFGFDPHRSRSPGACATAHRCATLRHPQRPARTAAGRTNDGGGRCSGVAVKPAAGFARPIACVAAAADVASPRSVGSFLSRLLIATFCSAHKSGSPLGRSAAWLLISSLLALGACAPVGPNFRRPAPALESDWIDMPARGRAAGGGPSSAFWAGFHDATLVRLLKKGDEQSPNLLSAVELITQARQQVRIDVGNLLPAVQAVRKQQLCGTHHRIGAARKKPRCHHGSALGAVELGNRFLGSASGGPSRVTERVFKALKRGWLRRASRSRRAWRAPMSMCA